jgi:large subunit ribosomal protein L6
VKVDSRGAEVRVKGPKGELSVPFNAGLMDLQIDERQVRIQRKGDDKAARAIHGLTRSLIANAVTGVTQRFSKRLDVFGVGFRAEVQGRRLTLHIGFSHPVIYEAPEGIELATENAIQGAQVRIAVHGIDKQQVGQTAAEIRDKRKPDPYKGKGIRYENEVIHWKAGKTASA